MSTRKYTPGPLHYDDETIVPEQFLTNPMRGGVWDRGGDLVAVLVRPFASEGDPVANGNLYAAAPELLEALEDIVASCRKAGVAIVDCSRGRAAIAKARGSA